MTADEVRKTLTDLGINQSEAARQIGISPRTMRRYVAGKPIPKPVELSLQHLRQKMRQAWTLEQLGTLKALYSTMPAKQVAHELGKSILSVYAKANDLKLKRYTKCDPSPNTTP